MKCISLSSNNSVAKYNFVLNKINTLNIDNLSMIKNYDEISGEKIIKLAKISQRISKKYKIPIAIAPPH